MNLLEKVNLKTFTFLGLAEGGWVKCFNPPPPQTYDQITPLLGYNVVVDLN